jgi:hypothetical protein
MGAALALDWLSGIWPMTTDPRSPLDYAAPSAEPPPRRVYLPIVFLCAAVMVWYRPRLTPTFFPDAFDKAMLVMLAIGAFVLARWSSLPGWCFVTFGAGGVALFLLANLNDNNFRENTNAGDVLWPWCAMVAAGGLISRLILLLGSALISRGAGPSSGRSGMPHS